MTALVNGIETAAPLGDTMDKNDISDGFGKKKDGGDGDETSIGSVGFDEDEITNDGNQNIEEGIEGGLDLDFAGAFPGGEDDKKWGGNDDGEGGELERSDGLAEEEPTKYEIENGGELDEDAEVGGIVDFEGFEVKDAGNRADDTSNDESND